MTEAEYIKTKALGTVTAAINTLKDLVPANLEEVMSEDEYRMVMEIICNWREKLFNQIETDSTELKAECDNHLTLFDYFESRETVIYKDHEYYINKLEIRTN